ncbi:hypothetical protein QBC32DRAFT_268485 [Pseudoneurospora amorphoporcata]|uniref:Wax synthase domain-containing protein n=1 Tax=Pseudoneurospora amorphoporcata TaxID=241081 RepID=A0AAN6NRQ1_9PEZI|nr:hypothetical protein QBC32DRAFT_268485 [Pseudoneurospora amorphoporcata]
MSSLAFASTSPADADAPPIINLAAHYLTTYRSIFYDALHHTNKVQPFLLPFCLVGSCILPVAYLCIPQYAVVTTTLNDNHQQVRIRREWIHHLRWLVGAVMVWWNLGIVVGLPGFGGRVVEQEGGSGGWVGRWFVPGKTTASACTAMAYAAGLMCGWGTIWGLETVVFGGYQGWAMRVRRRLRTGSGSGSGQPTRGEEVVNQKKHGKGAEGELNGRPVNGTTTTNDTTAKRQQSKSEQNNGIRNGSWGPDTTAFHRRRNLNLSSMFEKESWELADTAFGKVAPKGQRWTVDETVDLDKYEYYWEPYPDQGTVWERLDWVMDMFNSFRGAGWNYSISCIPSLQPPVIPRLPNSITAAASSSSSSQILPYFPTGLPVSFDNLPLSTPQNFHRSLTVRQFLTSRLIHMTWSYLALDFFTISARLDPYFILGPNGPLRHPTHLASLASFSSSTPVLPPLSLATAKFLSSLPPWGLEFARSTFSLSSVLGGLFLVSNLWQLVQFFVLGKLGKMLGIDSQGMDELWRYPSSFGGFVGNVLDRGLAGFWGGWWHQSFRVGFTGPVRFLVVSRGWLGGGRGYGEKTKKSNLAATLEMATAFFLSGVLHALGGWTCTAFRISPSSSSSSASGEHLHDLLTGEQRNRLPVFFEPVGFFVSQFVGCLVQAFLAVVLRNLVGNGKDKMTEIPRWLKRTGNGLFVFLWLHWTRWMLIDDMARSGLFLFEPVPVSVFRLLGLGGMPGEGGTRDWWRLDGEYVPGLWWGSSKWWWGNGVRI